MKLEQIQAVVEALCILNTAPVAFRTVRDLLVENCSTLACFSLQSSAHLRDVFQITNLKCSV